MAYLLGHHPKLKELAQAIVTLHAKLIDSDQVSIQSYPKIGDPTTPHQSPLLAAQCAEFTIYLTLYMNQEPSSVAAAMEILLEMIETIDSCGSFAEALLRNAQENINDSIKGLRQSSSYGFPGCAISIIDKDIPVLDFLKQALEMVEGVLVLKPILSPLVDLSDVAQQAQSSVVELKALFTKTGHFVLSIAENCFALQKFPSADSFGDAVNKLGSQLSGSVDQCKEAVTQQTRQRTRWFSKSGSQQALSEVRRSLDFAFLEFQTNSKIDMEFQPEYSADEAEQLAAAHWEAFEQNGSADELRQAILRYHEVRTLRPGSASLFNLANALISLYGFGVNAGVRTLKDGIGCYQEALDLRPEPNEERSLVLNGLANALMLLYNSDGSVDTLTRAISLRCEALLLLPANHPDYLPSHISLVNILIYIHRNREDPNTEAQINSVIRDTLGYQRHDDPDTSETINLPRPLPNPLPPVALISLAHARGASADSDKKQSPELTLAKRWLSAINLAQFDPPSPELEGSFTDAMLAITRHSLYRLNRNVSTLKESVSLSRDALKSLPTTHPSFIRSLLLRNLSSSLLSLEKRNAGSGDLPEIVETEHEVLKLHATGSPSHRCSSHANLSDTFSHQLEGGDYSVLDDAISHRFHLLDLYRQKDQYRRHRVAELLSLWHMRLERTGKEDNRGDIQVLQQEFDEFREGKGQGT